jgi:hypothetical protein
VLVKHVITSLHCAAHRGDHHHAEVDLVHVASRAQALLNTLVVKARVNQIFAPVGLKPTLQRKSFTSGSSFGFLKHSIGNVVGVAVSMTDQQRGRLAHAFSEGVKAGRLVEVQL